VSDFPPQDLRSFLEFCAGAWLTVRSSFELETAAALPGPTDQGGAAAREDTMAPHNTGEPWHAAQRGELVVAYLPPDQEGEPGGLEVTPPPLDGRAGAPQRLRFRAAGDFQRLKEGDEPEASGTWTLWKDGSLELTLTGREALVRERIWFTKPNLRLRSSVEQRHDGAPGRASFSSEIRRVSRSALPVDAG
jgi:hypothetical protein